MKPKGLALILVIIVAGFIPSHTLAAGLRCGVRIISEGDYKDKVLAECGAPDQVAVWEEERVYGFQYHPSYYGIYDNYEYDASGFDHAKPYRVRKQVVVEEWTYNHGPTRFMDHLRLENGIVREITSGDYGY